MLPFEEELTRILQEHTITGEELKLVVSRDGLHLTSIGLPSEVRDTFAAMCATMYGSAETAFFGIVKDFIDYINLASGETLLLVVGAGAEALIGVVIAKSTPLEEAYQTLKKIAGKVEYVELD